MSSRKKKPFINKKKAKTFHLVTRSNEDPLFGNENAPQLFLKPVNHDMTWDEAINGVDVKNGNNLESDIMLRENGQGQFDDAVESDDEMVDTDDLFNDKDIDFVDDRNDVDYDYSQHLRDMGTGGGLFVNPDGVVSSIVPTLPPITVENEDIDIETIDREVIDALDNAVTTKEKIDDNFIQKANLSESDIEDVDVPEIYENELSDIDKYDLSIDEDVYKNNNENQISNDSGLYPRHPDIDPEERTLMDEKFDAELKGFDDSSEDMQVPELMNPDDYQNIFDEFLIKNKKRIL